VTVPVGSSLTLNPPEPQLSDVPADLRKFFNEASRT
jgi:hypothetical protein